MDSIRSRVSDVVRRRRERDAGHVLPAALAAIVGLLLSVSAFLVVSHCESQLAGSGSPRVQAAIV